MFSRGSRQQPHRLSPLPLVSVGIDVHRQRDGRVAGQRLSHLWRDSRSAEVRDERVAVGVEVDRLWLS